MALTSRTERIENKVDKIAEDISNINVTLSGQHASLVEHMKRTNILEKQLEPIRNHVQMMRGAGKLIALLSTIALTIAGIAELFKDKKNTSAEGK